MSENALWQALRKNMRWQEATRHEEAFQSGVADVSFVAGGRHGWLELKFLPEWPHRAGTVVRIEHFTEDQRRWLAAKGKEGGRTWLLLQIGRGGTPSAWYGLFGWQSLDAVGTTERARLSETADYGWQRRLDYSELLAALSGESRERMIPPNTGPARGLTRYSGKNRGY